MVASKSYIFFISDHSSIQTYSKPVSRLTVAPHVFDLAFASNAKIAALTSHCLEIYPNGFDYSFTQHEKFVIGTKLELSHILHN